MKLKAIHLVLEKAYLLDSVWGIDLELDGEPLPRSQQVCLPKLDGIVQVSKRIGDITHYADATGEQISPDQYKDEKSRLLAHASDEEDDDGNPVFSSLEDEFAYRKFRQRWSAVRGPDWIERTPVEFEITEVRTNSGDPDIVSLWNSRAMLAEQCLYQIDTDGVMNRAFHAACSEAGLIHDNEGRAYLRFAKIERQYAFDNSFDESKRKFVGTLEQCKAHKAASIKRVTDIVEIHAAKKRGTALRGAAQVLFALQGIQTNLMGVRPKNDTAPSLLAARKSVAALIEEIAGSLKGDAA